MTRLIIPFWLAMALLALSSFSRSPPTEPAFTPLTVIGTPSPLGRADISVHGDWMVSSIPTRTDLIVTPFVDSIEIARLEDGRWLHAGVLFQGREIDGEQWKYEVPSIARLGNGWIAFAHKMRWERGLGPGVVIDGQEYTPEGNVAAGSVIAYRTAVYPGGAWSEEVTIPVKDWNIAAKGAIRAVVMTEPAALWHESSLYLQMTAISQAGTPFGALFRTDETLGAWEYRGQLLDGDYGAANLFEADGNIYINATPRGRGVYDVADVRLVPDIESIGVIPVGPVLNTVTTPAPAVRGAVAYYDGFGYMLHGIDIAHPPLILPAWFNGEAAP